MQIHFYFVLFSNDEHAENAVHSRVPEDFHTWQKEKCENDPKRDPEKHKNWCLHAFFIFQ